jgi:hypothetical protein
MIATQAAPIERSTIRTVPSISGHSTIILGAPHGQLPCMYHLNVRVARTIWKVHTLTVVRYTEAINDFNL